MTAATGVAVHEEDRTLRFLDLQMGYLLRMLNSGFFETQ